MNEEDEKKELSDMMHNLTLRKQINQENQESSKVKRFQSRKEQFQLLSKDKIKYNFRKFKLVQNENFH
jgi:hypothetical protein